MNKKLISVVTPCFNERERILPVLKTVLASNVVDEIVVVDDGSDIETKKILGSLPKKIKVITLPQNKGKAEAMKVGLIHTKGDLVLFVDSDLKGFLCGHIEQLIQPISEGSLDMVLGIRQYDVFYARWFNMSAPYSGERCFRRDILMKNLNVFDNKGYLIEAAINKIYFKKYRVGKVLMKGVSQTAKVKKNGLKGLLDSMKMSNAIIGSIGLREAMAQIKLVKRMPWLQ